MKDTVAKTRCVNAIVRDPSVDAIVANPCVCVDVVVKNPGVDGIVHIPCDCTRKHKLRADAIVKIAC